MNPPEHARMNSGVFPLNSTEQKSTVGSKTSTTEPDLWPGQENLMSGSEPPETFRRKAPPVSLKFMLCGVPCQKQMALPS